MFFDRLSSYSRMFIEIIRLFHFKEFPLFCDYYTQPTDKAKQSTDRIVKCVQLLANTYQAQVMNRLAF